MTPPAASLAAPAVTGYTFDQAADLRDSSVRGRLSPSAIRAFIKIIDRWDLTESEARSLLGGLASSTFHAWKTHPQGKRLDQDTLMRISLVLGIFKALNTYFGKPWANRWIKLENRGPLFSGRSPLEYMLYAGQPGMVNVRRMLDSWRGGR
jgi:hypothetical protein